MKLSLAVRLSVLILACATLVLALVVGYASLVSRGAIVEQARQNGEALAQATANRISAQFLATAKVTDTVAATLEDADLSRSFLIDLGRRVLASNPGIYGTATAFEPQAFERDKTFFAPYSFRQGSRITSTSLGGEGYNYFAKDWYQLARELNRPIWTEPYFDEGGGSALMVTYSAPFSRRTPRGLQTAGVVTADIDLAWLESMVSSVRALSSGYVFLLSRYGAYIAHPDPDLIMNETIFTHAEDLGLDTLRNLGRDMVAGRAGFAEFSDLPGVGEAFVSYLPLPDEGWSLGVVLPKAELLAGVNRVTHVMTGIGLAGFAALTAVILLLSASITRPLRALTRAARDISTGDLDQELPSTGRSDEVGELAASFSSMQTSLKAHIESLTAATAARERIESELRIARDIQMGILPKIFPPFPTRPELDVFATILPAREVGGDLYDFFFLDDNRFCFLIGDVSGKGVPAAFFMAVTKTLIKVVAEREPDPGRILAKVNDDLAADNESCMFVTLFLAILDTRDGRVVYANAGHNPPLLLPGGREPVWIESLEEPMAGAMPYVEYGTGSLTMAPGDAILLHTDGVCEAMNTCQALFSETRLLDTATRAGASAGELIRTVGDAVTDWARGAEQSDDITMLAVRYLGRDKRS